VVTADGGTTIPAPVLDRMAAQARADYRAKLRAKVALLVAVETGAPEALQNSMAAGLQDGALLLTAARAARTTEAGASRIDGPGRRGELRIVPDPEPEIPATPCPPFCVLDHKDPGSDGARTFHYSHTEYVEETGLSLDACEGQATRVQVSAPSRQEYYLTPEQARNLSAALARYADQAEAQPGTAAAA